MSTVTHFWPKRAKASIMSLSCSAAYTQEKQTCNEDKPDCTEVSRTDCCTMQQELERVLHIAPRPNTAEGINTNKVLHQVRKNVHMHVLPASNRSDIDAPGLIRMHWLT